jgi:hypothetical protein
MADFPHSDGATAEISLRDGLAIKCPPGDKPKPVDCDQSRSILTADLKFYFHRLTDVKIKFKKLPSILPMLRTRYLVKRHQPSAQNSPDFDDIKEVNCPATSRQFKTIIHEVSTMEIIFYHGNIEKIDGAYFLN